MAAGRRHAVPENDLYGAPAPWLLAAVTGLLCLPACLPEAMQASSAACPPVLHSSASPTHPHLPPPGALFFYLREQLTEFAGRLRSLDIELRLTALPAEELAPALRKQVGHSQDSRELGRVRGRSSAGAALLPGARRRRATSLRCQTP